MTTKNIDVELLISLVENRPLIWDKTLDDYKLKNLRTVAWREICLILKDDFEEMEERKRKEYAKYIIKKWTNIRDSWMRSINEKKKTKKSREYIHHRQLMFLKKIATRTGTHDSAMDQDNLFCEEDAVNNECATTGSSKQETNIENAGSSKRRKSSKSSRQNLNVFDKKMSKFLDYKIDCKKKEKEGDMKEDRNLFFFKSLLPSLATLQDNQILEFQSGVLKLLLSIKNRNEWSPAHSATISTSSSITE